jgi:phosphoglycolate phosphatase
MHNREEKIAFMMTEKKAIMFDYDGVIADSFECFFGAYQKACYEVGLDELANKAVILELFESNFYEAVHRKFNKSGCREFLKALGRCLEEAGLNYKVFDGMVEVLEKISERANIFIVTANIGGIVRKHLAANGINAISKILGAEVATSKIERINRIKQMLPEAQYFFVTDTLGDIIEAKAAGTRVIAVQWGWHDLKTLKKGEPDYIIGAPLDLLTIL